jgi:pyridoxine 4-dehydrogenase
MPLRFAHGPENIRIGDFDVRRFGYGAMRLPGKDVWGEPEDPARAHAVLRRAIEHGINLIDTAWYYGPYVSNRLIAEALYPYPSDLVIATKLGARRNPDKSWVPALTVEALLEGVEHDLRTLRLEQLPLVHLRWVEQSEVTFVEALDALIAIQATGKVRHIGLSAITVEQLEIATARTPIACVQNLFNMGGPGHELDTARPEAVLAACENRGIAFLPFFPLAIGSLTSAGGALAAAAKRHNCTPAQLALAWLLARSPVMLPIPGTSQVAHLDENVGALHVTIDHTALAELGPNA